MDPHQKALEEYIAGQRHIGQPDEEILDGLVARGWQPEMVRSALTTTPGYAPASSIIPVEKVGFFTGRIGRLGYVLGILYSLSLFIIPIILTVLIHGSKLVNIIAILCGIFGIIMVIPIAISLHIRRLHDIDQSGWLTFLILVPVFGLLLSLALFILPGSKTANRFGQPYARSLGPLSLFGLRV